MTEHDFDEWMRSVDPARRAPIPAPDSERARAIRDAALGRPRSRRGLVAAIAAVVVLISAAAVGAVVWLDQEPERIDVSCFAQADLNADRVQADLRLGTGTDACVPLWQDGSLGDGPTVPPLVACVLAGGSTGVFPGDQSTCGALGLAPATQDDGSIVASTHQLDQAVRAAVTGDGRCVDPADAVDAVRTILADQGLDETGWTVEQTTPTSDDRPCASYSIDEPAQLVAIVPIPRD